MAGQFQVSGTNEDAPFTLRVHRGDGMALLAMNWRGGEPPDDFVGFGIEYREPGGSQWFAVQNRLTFEGVDRGNKAMLSSMVSPLQKFRWVHFPRNADLPGLFTYRVTPMFMNAEGVLSGGEPQQIKIVLRRDTYPGELNVTFTRGFVASQAFTDRYAPDGKVIGVLLPAKADEGLTFTPSHPDADEALAWMGFEARDAILDVLDEAVAHPDAEVLVVAYDLSEPEIVDRLEALGPRLRIIIDDSDEHEPEHSGESQAAVRLMTSAGAANVRRQHMGDLQHNKTVIVTGLGLYRVVCGSTNYSWRGFYVQNNNALVISRRSATLVFRRAFEQYWASDSVSGFGASPAADWEDLGLPSVDAKVTFSPHSDANRVLDDIAADIRSTTSSLFYSMAFLAQTQGSVREAITEVTEDDDIFVFGMADMKVGGIKVQSPDGNLQPVKPAALTKAPPPFKSETSGGGGIRLHHKFAVIDFDQPTARVYLGSYNFSGAADTKNGENLVVVRDRRVAVSYMIEAVRIFDHYQFRNKELSSAPLNLRKPPTTANEKPWWDRYYTEPARIRDRELFS
jgi:phosphatidylserine/phosphatidylglycerophosphate/cardiolipin synthase-like enzyme